MNFIAALRNGSYTAQMARARNLALVSLAGLEFTWNGRQYQTGILPDISQEVQDSPQITISAFGTAPVIDPVLAELEAEDATIQGEIKAEKAKPGPKPAVKKAV